MRWRAFRDGGFTLLELLVGVTLLAIFAVMLSGGFSFGLEADRQVNEGALTTDGMLRTAGFLRERIQLAQPIWVDSPNAGHVDFSGTESSLEFLAPTPQSLGGIGFLRYVFTVEADGSHRRLIGRVEPRELSPGQAALASSTLIYDASSVVFTYYGKRADGSTSAWQSSWIGRHDMPRLVAVRAISSGPIPQIVISLACTPSRRH